MARSRTDAGLLDERATYWRTQGLTDTQLRAELRDEGFSASEIRAWITAHPHAATPPRDEQTKPGSTPEGDRPTSSRPASSGGFSLTSKGSSGRGVLLALVAYPLALAYLQGGPTGLKDWFRAKFLNRTATDPGATTTLFMQPGVTGAGGSGGVSAAADLFAGLPSSKTRSSSSSSGGGAGSGAARRAIAFARAQLGKPYRWGATGPNAFDCSGLVQASYRAAGVKLPRTTYQQVLVGHRVTKAQLAPGDLVFPDPGHVQMYLGGGQIIESPHTGAKVRIMPLGPVWQARRIA